MSNNTITAEPGDTVELKDKEGGFTDPDTGFDISRDQKKKLGDSIGARTMLAIQSGGLLLVSGGAKPKEKTGDNVESDLPEDLPGRKEFIAAGLNFEQVKNLKTDDDLKTVKGIGDATIKALKVWAEKAQLGK